MFNGGSVHLRCALSGDATYLVLPALFLVNRRAHCKALDQAHQDQLSVEPKENTIVRG